MRARLIVIGLIVAAIAAFEIYTHLRPATPSSVVANAVPSAVSSEAAGATPEAVASAGASPEAGASAEPGASPATSESPGESASPAAESSESPSPQPTMPTPPPGLPKGWEQETERVVNGPEADLVVRTGAIDNLGFGWPAHYTPFSGESTPPHTWLCDSRPGSAPGTDRSMLGSAVTQHDVDTRPKDGYSGCSKRPDNLPQAVPLQIGDLPPVIHQIFVQMFLDDFQAPSFNSHFQVSLNGTRIPAFEDTINQMDQTGPIGKLLTLRLLPEYWPIVKSGNVNLLIDDPTTGAPDGYAINFVRILVNPKPFRYAVIVHANVIDQGTRDPIKGASVAAAQVTETTDAAGNASLHGVPAGLVSVTASAVGYDSQTKLLDLPAGQVGTVQLLLAKHKENIEDLKAQLQKNGSIAIYGIHFDTASAKLRPDSASSLNTILKLVQSSPGTNWTIAGHTDNQGGADYNMNLSLARAHSVVAWLEQHGIASNRLTAKGYGLTRPVADNATDAGRALNRRVEVSIQK